MIRKNFSGIFVIELKMKCFNYEMARACETYLDQISQKKTYSTNINMLKRKPANEYYPMLHYYIGECEHKQSNIDFESAKEIFMKKDYKMVMKRRLRGYIIRWNVKRTRKTKIFLKTKRCFLMDSNILKQTNSMSNF